MARPLGIEHCASPVYVSCSKCQRSKHTELSQAEHTADFCSEDHEALNSELQFNMKTQQVYKK